MTRHDLYPPLDPYETGRLSAGSLHSLYWEQSGNPTGVPVLLLHGGPGAGASPTHRRFFDSHHYRIVILDQRGAGRSAPLGETRENRLDLLVDDLERLRRHLGIARWHLFGGSWGSTLALAYAQAHPERVLSLILYGIFLIRPHEVAWFLTGMRAIFPEAWGRFAGHVGLGGPATTPEALLAAYAARLDDPDPGVRIAAARAWSHYEGACSTLRPNQEVIASANEEAHALGLARIETHYFRTGGLTPEDRLLRDVGRIRHLPAVIVQGRYDIVCPIATADELRRAWPEADYVIVPDGAHSAAEPGIRAALLQATARFKALTVARA